MTNNKDLNYIAECAESVGIHVDEHTAISIPFIADVMRKMREQEPCEDCISRQAVNDLIDELARAISDERCCMSRGRSTATIMQDILDLPPVTKPKTGHWIATEKDWWKCSECGQVIYSETEQDRQEYHAYCGRCGAKMLPTDSEKEWLPQYEGKWVAEKE